MAEFERYDWQSTDPTTGQPVPPRQNIPVVSTNTNGRLLNGLAYLIGKSVIPRLAYPGTMARMLDKFSGIMVRWQRPKLEKCAAELVKRMKAKRFRLKTRTGNTIDSMFVDRRGMRKFPNGNVLVITCEGNYMFYEDGVSEIPLKLGYSVLMWNHPGYGESSGYPSPAEEQAAIDVVVQFAIFGCGWSESDMVVYGWSIGGYTASWAVMNYPNIRAVILDATFDDLLLMAQKWVPKTFHSLIGRAVRTYWNLDIGQQLLRYKGPVLLLRRSEDQLMSMETKDGKAMRRTNRLNWLMKMLMRDRYPGVFGEDESVDAVVEDWLKGDESTQDRICKSYEIDETDWMVTALREHVLDVAIMTYYGIEMNVFPMPIGYNYDSMSRMQMALFLISRYLTEFDSDHYKLLDRNKFVLPSHPWEAEIAEDVIDTQSESVITPSSSESSSATVSENTENVRDLP